MCQHMIPSEVAMRGTNELDLAVETPWMADKLVSVRDIRVLFALGRTAAYELTRRPDFPEPVVVSPRCYRWWASEVTAFAARLRNERPSSGRATDRRREQAVHPSAPPLRINGTVRAARTRWARS